MASFTTTVETVALVIDGAGVTVIVLGLKLRNDIGRGILLSLELLIAADIIRTVAVVPTLRGVLILGLIVLIRTFLSMALQIELEGRLPWKPHQRPAS